MKILMVCLGNICRSPLAEGIMRHKAEQHGKAIEVDSCGTSGYHNGENPDPRSVENAMKNGIDIANLVSRQFKLSDLEDHDMIYVMDGSNFNDIMDKTRNEEERSKVKLILNEVHPEENRNVPDPYFGGETGFQDVFDLLEEACENILENRI